MPVVRIQLKGCWAVGSQFLTGRWLQTAPRYEPHGFSLLGGVGLVTKSCPTLVTPWIITLQAPLSIGLSRQEYWSGLPFASPGNLPDPGIEPGSPALQADSLPSEPLGKPKTKSGKTLLKLHLGQLY